jgi:hypothetical protein
MPTDYDSDQIRPAPRRHQRNTLPPLRPQGVVSLEALGRLAQQIARILQRIRAEGSGRVDHLRRGH